MYRVRQRREGVEAGRRFGPRRPTLQALGTGGTNLRPQDEPGVARHGLEAEQIVSAVDDAVAKQVAQHEILEAGRRGEEQEPDDAADLDRHRHLVGTPLFDFGIAAAAQGPGNDARHASRRPPTGRRDLARRPIEIAPRIGEQEGDDAGRIVEIQGSAGPSAQAAVARRR